MLRLAIFATASLALFAPGCGGSEEEPAESAGPASLSAARGTGETERAETPAGLSRLVPRDASLYLQLSSAREAAAALERLRGLGSASDSPVQPSELLAMLGVPGNLEAIDPERPLGVAFNLMGGAPMPSFVVPVSDARAYADSVAGMGRAATASSGDYVGVSRLASYGEDRRPNPMTEGLPAGELVLRADLGVLVEGYRPMIDAVLSQAEQLAMAGAAMQGSGGADVGPILDAYLDGFETLLDSAEGLDLAAAASESELRLAATLTVREKSPLAVQPSKREVDLRELAGRLDPEASVTMVIGMDMAELGRRFQPFFESMIAANPEPLRSSMAAGMEAWDEIFPLLGDELAFSGDLGEGGMRFAYAFNSPDPEALIAGYRRSMASFAAQGGGATVEEIGAGEVAGAAVTEFRVAFDLRLMAEALRPQGPAAGGDLETAEAALRALYGEDGLRVRIAAEGERVTMVIGGDDEYLRRAIERSRRPGEPSPALRDALIQAEGLDPVWILRVDAGALMQSVGSLLEGLGQPAPDPAAAPASAPITLVAGADRRRWYASATADLAGLRSLRSAAFGDPRKVRARTARAEIALIGLCIDTYMVQNGGRTPGTLDELVTPDENGARYFPEERIPLDPWGRPYVYEAPAEGRAYIVLTYGADGEPGGAGEDADSSSEDLREDR